jgi:hypothetical protein
MNRKELDDLFLKYLKRIPSQSERRVHGSKNYNDFELEILNCDEYYKINGIIKKDVNIAILLTGHIRKNSILDGIRKFCNNADIFIHTWDNLGIKGSETNINDKINYNQVLNEINKYPNLKNYKIENNKNYINSLENVIGYFNFSSPEKFIKSQLYSINESYKLMEEYSVNQNVKYDIVFKFRFDCTLDVFNIKEHLKNDIISNKIIFTPNIDCKHNHPDYGTSCWACDNMYYRYGLKKVHIFEHTNVVCDLFAYGNMESMKKYCDLYNHYDELNNSFKEQNLEQLKEHNKNIKLEDGDYKLKDMNGHIDSLYYYNCSYPERLLQKFLKDYMLIESREVRLNLVR